MSEQSVHSNLYTCITCSETKSVDGFFLDRRKKYAIRPRARCKACITADVRRKRANDPEHFRKMESKSYRKRFEEQWDNRRRRAQRMRLRTFGITDEDFMSMYERQGKKCAVCERPVALYTRRNENWDGACIDHCHSTGRVRGILCNPCNVALGLLQDNPDRIERMREYIMLGALK